MPKTPLVKFVEKPGNSPKQVADLLGHTPDSVKKMIQRENPVFVYHDKEGPVKITKEEVLWSRDE